LLENFTTQKRPKLILPHIVVDYRLNYMAVGLTNTPPSVTAPTWLNYALCAKNSGTLVESIPTFSLQCSPTTQYYRYVILQTPVTNDALSVCEVQVFLRCMLPECMHIFFTFPKNCS
jgi:hypothetical protein